MYPSPVTERRIVHRYYPILYYLTREIGRPSQLPFGSTSIEYTRQSPFASADYGLNPNILRHLFYRRGNYKYSDSVYVAGRTPV